jgi:enamine deaminase RidA (YjgF/YER057c/UK114 family)
MSVRGRLEERGLVLPAAMRSPSGRPYPFLFVRRRGGVAYLAGHLPLNADGTIAEPRGKVGSAVSREEAAEAARKVGLAMLGSLERELGDLERVVAWTRVLGMVNTPPGFTEMPVVLNAFSELVLDLFGAERGAHSRSAVGVSELPFDVPVEIEAEVEVRD